MFRVTAVFALAGIVSGFVTPHLSDGLRLVLPDWTIVEIPLSLLLAGLAFAAALIFGLTSSFGFQQRYLLIVPFVLVGWFCAMQVCLWTGSSPPKPFALFSGAELSPHGRYWASLAAYATAGALGALITALGTPSATRDTPTRTTFAVITLTGAGIAAAWFVATETIPALSHDEHWYALFVPWQAAVAALIGNSVRETRFALTASALTSPSASALRN
jgi:hypothetical protein